MTELDFALAHNRATNGRIVTFMLFLANALMYATHGGMAAALGMLCAMLAVGIVYLAETSVPMVSFLGGIVASLASAALFLTYVV